MNAAPFRISVIVPVYNHAQYLAESLRSVLDQSFPVHETIVVDDGSRDGSAEVARAFPGVQVLEQANGGISAARNAGFKVASGDLLAFQDADDIWHLDKLKSQVAALQERPELDMVFTMTKQFLSPDLSPAQREQRKIDQEILPGRFAGTMLVRRSAYERVGDFREDLRTAEFVDWYGRAQSLGIKDLLLPEVLHQRRVHAANHGIRESQSRGDYFRALKDAVDRRRKEGDAS